MSQTTPKIRSPKTLSRRMKEPPGLWLARFKAHRANWETLLRTRRHYRDAIDLNVPGLKSDKGIDVGSLRGFQPTVFLFHRSVRRFQAQLYDPNPELRVTRTGEGEPEMAQFQEMLVSRALDDAKAYQQVRPVITDDCWAGHGFVWLGLDFVPSYEATTAMRKGAGEATTEALKGGHEPHPSHDHEAMAKGLDATSKSPLAEGMTEEQRVSLDVAREVHRAMDAEEAEDEKPWVNEKNRIWATWSPPGRNLWDPLVSDISHSRWMARMVVMPVDLARQQPQFRPEAAKKIQPQRVYDDYEGGKASERLISLPGLATHRVEEENGLAVMVEAYDSRDETTHWLSETVPGEYLEADERYPYFTEDGRVGIPGFFPCAPCIVDMAAEANPYRAFGVPVLAGGWPQQIELPALRREMLDGAKKRKIIPIFHANVDQATQSAISTGKDLVGVLAPPGIAPDQVVYFATPLGTPPDWSQEMQLLERDFFNNVGQSPAEFTGQSQDTTATEAGIIAQAAQTDTGDFGTQIEGMYARMATIARALIRIGYSVEHVAQLVGPKYVTRPKDEMTGEDLGPSMWERFKASSDEGDEIRARIASRARDEDPVRITLLDRILKTAMTVDPVTLMPLAKPETILRELFRAAHLGDPEKYGPEDQAAMLFRQQVLAKGQGGKSGKNGAEGGSGVPNRGAIEGAAHAKPAVGS